MESADSVGDGVKRQATILRSGTTASISPRPSAPHAAQNDTFGLMPIRLIPQRLAFVKSPYGNGTYYGTPLSVACRFYRRADCSVCDVSAALLRGARQDVRGRLGFCRPTSINYRTFILPQQRKSLRRRQTFRRRICRSRNTNNQTVGTTGDIPAEQDNVSTWQAKRLARQHPQPHDREPIRCRR